MASAALLFSFSAVVFLFLLLQAPPGPGLAVGDLLASALDRFFLDGRGVLELATRRNMILLCHAILFLILRDAGVLGAPASRRSRTSSPPGEAGATAVVVVAQTAAPVPAPARPHATTSAVVVAHGRPRNRAAAPMYDAAAAAHSIVEYRPAAEAAATRAAPLLTTGPAAHAAEEAAKQIFIVESPKIDHDRVAVVEPLEHPTSIAADDSERDGFDDRRIVADDDEKRIDDTAGEHQTAGIGMEMEMELADDRTSEEFIKSQRRRMRQESLRLVSSG